MTDTPKPQAGTWTLIAPDGNHSWQAGSPLQCAALEQRERVPPQVALQRIERTELAWQGWMACFLRMTAAGVDASHGPQR